MADQIWRLQIGHGPLVATAIHDGHELREELIEHISLDDAGRLREEVMNDCFRCVLLFATVWTSVAALYGQQPVLNAPNGDHAASEASGSQ